MLRVFQGGVGFFFSPPIFVFVSPCKAVPICHGSNREPGEPCSSCCDIPCVSETPGEGVTSAGTDFFPSPDTKQTLSDN